MELSDFNQTHVPPPGYTLDSFDARGAYLWAKYKRPFFFEGTQRVRGYDTTEVFLNDMGREVARTTDKFIFPTMPVAPPDPAPVGRWFRFKNGFLIVLQGLQEMIRCLNKS